MSPSRFAAAGLAAAVILSGCGPGSEETRSDETPGSNAVARTRSAAAPPAERLRVGARLGDELPVPDEAAPLRRVSIGRASRAAVCRPPPFSLEIEPPPEAARLRFALGVRPPGPKGPAVELAIDLQVTEGDRALLRRRLARSGAWRDVSLAIANGTENSSAEAPVRIAVRGRPAFPVCLGSVAFDVRDAAPPKRRPNVLLLSLDTLGAPYLGRHGGLEDASPRIDAFLAESFDFRRAIAQFGQTLVSHSSLFSAQYPRVHRRYSSDFGIERPPLDSLVPTISQDGYLSAAFTENGYVASQFGFDEGFDSYDDGPDDVVAERGHSVRTFGRAADWLRRFGRDTRFFLFVHSYEVHSPYVPDTPEAHELANRLSLPGDRRIFTNDQTHTAFHKHRTGEAPFSKREQTRLRALYHAELLELDGAFDALLATLAELGLERDTIVLVTSDHGEAFGEKGAYAHGVTLHNRIVNVPLAFRWPGRIEPGVAHQPVQLIDGMTTLLDLLGLEAPAPGEGRRRDGRSLAPLLLGDVAPDSEPETPAFSDELHPRPHCRPRDPDPACWVEHYAVQSRRFKLVRSRDGRYERFYDLERDPAELRNVLGEEDNAEALEQHRAWLDAYLAASDDLPWEALRVSQEEGAADDLDPEVRARLEALGYVF